MSTHDRRPRIDSADARELEQVLCRQLEVVDELIHVTRSMGNAIVEQAHAAIEEHVSQKEGLLQRLGALEATRAAMIARWVPGGDARLDQVVALMPREEGEAVLGHGETLRERLGELDRLNQQNASLLYCSLAVVQTMLRAMTGEEARGTIYGPGKGAAGRTVSATLDWRA